MKFQGAHIRENGVEFAIVIVKPSAMQTDADAHRARSAFQRYFPGIPLVLMSQDLRGIPTYQGRQDLVEFLASVDLAMIPWSEYTTF